MIRGFQKGASGVWADLPLRGKGLVLIAIPLAALLTASSAYFVSERADQRAEAAVAHTQKVRVDIKEAIVLLSAASNGVRGYLLTDDKIFLAAYELAIKALPGDLGELARLVQDRPVQVGRMHRITSLAEQQLDTFANLRYSARSSGQLTGPQREFLVKSKTLMDALDREFGAMQAEEDRLLAERVEQNERVHKRILDVIALSLLLGLSCGIVAAILFTAGIGRRIKRLSENAVRLAQGFPLAPVPFGNDEIGRLGRALEQSSVLLIEREQELRGAKEEAEKANEAKSEFLSRMSHELRTPLNAILGFGQLLEMDHLSSEQQESVQHILKGGRHLLGLIDEVLNIARIEAGRLVMSPEPVRVSEALQGALDLVGSMAAARSVRLNSDRKETCHRHVLADRQRLQQVFLNLLSNAVKYNHSGGTVTLSCQEANGRLRVKVTDTGPGIPADMMGRLFTPFDRLGAEQTGVEGSGLGLSLSKGLVEAMGGTLGVESTPGQGSTFWVELSMVDSPLERIEKAGAPAPAPAELEPSRKARVVLYVEDNLSNLRLIQRLLVHRPEITLIPAMQGEFGLQLAREHRPHLILLDLQLPDIPGHKVLRLLRDMPETRDIPVIVISADATPGQIDRLLAAGAWRYMTKPLDVGRFLSLLDEALKEPESDRAGRYA